MELRLNKRPKNPIIIEGFPGFGFVGTIATALDFAYKLHTDIGDGFIKAIDVKTKKIIGKEHKLKNLDVIEIITKK